ncbi:hypothetical protein FQN52_001655 [Onygenales sp. PD_12]|nr:hypothetical protein FQN52_001655 [Onygenales sp. PD_12]
MDGSSNIKFFSAPSKLGGSDVETNEIPTTTPSGAENDVEIIEINDLTPPTLPPTVECPTDDLMEDAGVIEINSLTLSTLLPTLLPADEHPGDECPTDEHFVKLQLLLEGVFINLIEARKFIDD